jgi:23S rRNA (cytidine1920-2'-O)/16S rRNA (cytidine1409-2'-O)-methyltransferase
MVDRKLAESRNRAQSLILEGKVTVDGTKVTKAGVRIPTDAIIEVDAGPTWASRGALKLLKAIEAFSTEPRDKVCIDIGASSGGFTDVLLSLGAKRIFAVDVGYGQLAWRLRNDPRVTVMERTNARNLQAGDLDETPDLAVVDVAFISLSKILPAVEILLAARGECICLVKPQFEAGREAIGKNGVVRDKKIHLSVLLKIKDHIENSSRMSLTGADFSPILGPRGNMEFLFHIINEKLPVSLTTNEAYIEEMVERAHIFNFSRSAGH